MRRLREDSPTSDEERSLPTRPGAARALGVHFPRADARGSQSDTAAGNGRSQHDFFRKELAEEQQLRGQCYKIFDEMTKMPAK